MSGAGWHDANGVMLRYEVSGEGPLLVLLHEMGGNLHSWDALAGLLAGWRVLRPDARGAGLSEKITGSVTLDDLVGDLAALLDGVGGREPAVLVGCAVGAAVALAYAARHPERAAAVAAIAPAVGMAESRRADALALAGRIAREGVRGRVLERIDHSFPTEYRTDSARFDAFKGIVLGQDPASYAAIYRMLATLDLMEELPRVRCPVLVLAGETDQTRPPEQCRAVAAAIPGARFESIRSGHVMALLTPALLASTLAPFLDAARRAD